MKIILPKRVSHSYKQQINGTPAQVFPLLCPVREADWIKGWDPLLVVSNSGLAEKDCVFVTSAEPDDAIWYITQHDAERGFVEMLKITPSVTACRLTIQLTANSKGTESLITYTHTSLGEAGDKFVDEFTAEFYGQFMRDWEARMNHYLASGEALEIS